MAHTPRDRLQVARIFAKLFDLPLVEVALCTCIQQRFGVLLPGLKHFRVPFPLAFRIVCQRRDHKFLCPQARNRLMEVVFIVVLDHKVLAT